MKRLVTGCFLLLTLSVYAQKKTVNPPTKTTISEPERNQPFDDNWLFIRDSVTGAEQPDYNDSEWKPIDLPHDWSVEDLPDQIRNSISGPFSKASIGATATGFTVGGTGWYRKAFILSAASQNKKVTIHFDGIYMNADVWLNGHHLGNHPYGYTPFYYYLTPYLKPAGEKNTIAVRVRNEGKNTRWYSGSGIYRHVWLTVTEPLHIAPNGIYITTPGAKENNASVQIKTTVNNEHNTATAITIHTTLITPNGKVAGTTQSAVTIAADNVKEFTQNISLAHPALWSVETPHLYTAVTEIKVGNKIIDKIETPFGIRSIQVDAKTGFTLNGKKILLRGGCIHHDNGPLGAAAIDRAEERKIEILKKNGFNAIRTSHNPPSSALLAACDRLGMLVIDEAFDMWERPKNPQDYHLYFDEWWQKDLDAMILRDRNHPSVVFWSIGNEINERADSSGLAIAKRLIDGVKRLDTTRPVTEAICSFWEPENRGKNWSATASAFALLDVGGYNYQWREYEPDHQKYPQRIMMGTESIAKEALENWNRVEKHPYVIGDFVWTAFDYMGEAAIGHTILNNRKDSFTLGWPWYNAWCGDIDITGYKKPQSYYRDVVWRQSKIEMAVHRPMPDSLKEIVSYWGWPDEVQSWTWPGSESRPLEVRVFSRAPMVRLLLNGKTVGEQKMGDSSITAVFEVLYQPGLLKAVNIEGGKETDAVVLKTTGAPHHIRLTADRSAIKASRNDLAYIAVEVVDDQNNVVPTAHIPIHFTVTGAGELAAVGNADPTDLSSFHQLERTTFRGRCIAIIRPKKQAGTIVLQATAKDLKPARIVVTSK